MYFSIQSVARTFRSFAVGIPFNAADLFSPVMVDRHFDLVLHVLPLQQTTFKGVHFSLVNSNGGDLDCGVFSRWLSQTLYNNAARLRHVQLKLTPSHSYDHSMQGTGRAYAINTSRLETSKRRSLISKTLAGAIRATSGGEREIVIACHGERQKREASTAGWEVIMGANGTKRDAVGDTYTAGN